MKDSIMRILASVLSVGMILWMPGLPLAWATISPEVAVECEHLISENPTVALGNSDPEYLEIALELTDSTVQVATTDNPETLPPDVQAAAAGISETAEEVSLACATAASLELPQTTDLTQAIIQTGAVSTTDAALLADKAQAALTQCLTSLDSGDPLKAEAALKSLQQECQRLGVDPSVLASAAGSTEGLTCDKVLFEAFSAGGTEFNFNECLSKAGEVYQTAEAIRSYADQQGFTGGPMEGGFGVSGATNVTEMLKQIDSMVASGQVSGKEADFMKQMADSFSSGNIEATQQVCVEAARDHMEGMITSGSLPEGMTPELMREQFAAYADRGMPPMDVRAFEHMGTMGFAPEAFGSFSPMEHGGFYGPVSGMEVYGMTPEAFAAASGMTMDPVMMEAMTHEMTTKEAVVAASYDSIQSGGTSGGTAVAIIYHDHNSDGNNEHHHQDSNGNGLVDVGEPVGISGL